MHECIDVPVCCGPHKVCSLRCQRRLCSRRAAVLHGVEKRATVVAVDVYGGLLDNNYCSTGRTSTQRSTQRCMGKARMEGRRVVDGIGMSCHLSAEMWCVTLHYYSSVLHPVRPVSCVQRPASSVLTPKSKMTQRNANSDFEKSTVLSLSVFSVFSQAPS